MDDTRSGAGTYGGIAFILLVAIAALAFFKFDFLGVQSLISGIGERTDTDNTTPSDPPPTRVPAATDTFPEQPPQDERYAVNRTAPLPQRLVIQRRAGSMMVELAMRLVPQGWFIMGDDDGVMSNMPQRWIWLDDYYLAETECTNEQYFAFVRANGYDTAQYWTPEGYELVQAEGWRGATYLGWLPVDANERMWALASPHVELSIEIQEPGRNVPVPEGRNVLVIPGGSNAPNWIRYDSTSGAVRTSVRGTWRDANGLDVSLDPRAAEQGFLHKTDAEGRVALPNPGKRFDLTIIAWADGDFQPPLIGRASRFQEHELREPSMPVVGMSWFEAEACCRFFGGTLPTEAQWEKAARGANGLDFPWGNQSGWGTNVDVNGVARVSTPHANINRSPLLMPVGSFPSGNGPYGHADLAGNVSEWCADVYLERPRWAEANPKSVGGPRERRSERGTNIRDDEPLPSVRRRYLDAYTREGHARGFRIAMTPEAALQAAGR